MSRGLRITFLIHAIVALIFGIVMYLQPALWANLVNWTPFDRHVTRLYGAALLALAVGSWFGYRAAHWEEVRILLLLEIAFTVLSTIAGLWIVLFSAGPIFAWIAIAIWVIFAAAWIYFYTSHPAQA